MRGRPEFTLEDLAREAARGVSAQRLSVRYKRSTKFLVKLATENGIALRGPLRMKSETAALMGTPTRAHRPDSPKRPEPNDRQTSDERREEQDERAFPDRDPSEKKTGEF